MLFRILALVSICFPLGAVADDKLVRLHAPAALEESGLLSYILPRFSLKTQIRVERVEERALADIALGETGTALFERAQQVWHLELRSDGHAGSERLADWLRSEVGQRAVTSFTPVTGAPFTLIAVEEVQTAALEISGDAALGHKVSLAKCTRCHAVDEATRGSGIGSAPSFGVLRSMADWQARFASFYALNPHPAFTQITDVTPPFPEERPSPIVPIELTLDELDAVLAYMAAMAPADLGQPLQHQ